MPTLHATLSLVVLIGAPRHTARPGQDELTSGRPIPAEQSCYDVLHYDLRVRVDPAKRSIVGQVEMQARLLAPSADLVLDLDQRFDVAAVRFLAGEAPDWQPLEFAHRSGELRIHAAQHLPPVGSDFRLRVEYAGKPREAPRPPWDGGFVWSETPGGAPWIATANQMQGADLWWPCKDQPDDEPDSMRIAITVPDPLIAASNGRLEAMTTDFDALTEGARPGWRTFRWAVSTPINAYGVALNIAPYATISREYTSVAGDVFPVTYWVLPENLERGQELFEDILRQMRFMEETFGPYPFRGDKYGVAETPHLGMEHQTIIAYGNQYQGNPWGEQYGFDMLHLHEFAHEWWANLVTCANWNDFWIHEGFASYSQALYTEKLLGEQGYLAEMRALRGGIQNRAAVAPREKRSTAEMYFGKRPDSPGGDIYNKGAWIVHSLRWLVGDEVFFRMLRRMAYPDPALEKATDGSACRFATTDGLRSIAEHELEQELDWFFELYLRQPELPVLESRVAAGKLQLTWETPGDLPFPMPVEVRLGDEYARVECPGGKGSLALAGRKYEIDPRRRTLRESDDAR